MHWDPYLHTWVVTRYADVHEVLHTYSADRTHTPEKLRPWAWPNESHRRVDGAADAVHGSATAHPAPEAGIHAFTPARVAVLRSHIREIVSRLLDRVEDDVEWTSSATWLSRCRRS